MTMTTVTGNRLFAAGLVRYGVQARSSGGALPMAAVAAARVSRRVHLSFSSLSTSSSSSSTRPPPCLLPGRIRARPSASSSHSIQSRRPDDQQQQKRGKATYERFGQRQEQQQRRPTGGWNVDEKRSNKGENGTGTGTGFDDGFKGFSRGGGGGSGGGGGGPGWRSHPIFLALRRRLGDRGLMIWSVGLVGGGGYYLVQ